jgi:hypothetical protein
VRLRWPTVAVVVLVATFWIGDLVGSRAQPGYEVGRDYVSALAAYGAHWPWIGIAAITASGLAHGAAALSVRTIFPGSRWAPGMLAVACVMTLVVAAARITCVEGAARCHLAGSDPTRRWTDAVHGRALLGYEAALILAALGVAVLAGRGGRRQLAVASVVLAIASPALALSIDAANPGVGERWWIAAGHAWLIILAATAASATIAAGDP